VKAVTLDHNEDAGAWIALSVDVATVADGDTDAGIVPEETVTSLRHGVVSRLDGSLLAHLADGRT